MKNRIPRKLKKKYKKMGIWNSYLRLQPFYANHFDHNGECLNCDKWFSDCVCD